MATAYDYLKPVESSMFSRAGYDEENWLLLFEFKSTHEIRAYKDVTPETAEMVLSSPSLGKYFNSEIKGNGAWEFEVLGADPSQEKPVAAPAEKPELTIMDADIKLVEPGWNGKTIEAKPAAPTMDFGVKEFDPETGHWPKDAVNEGGAVKEEAIAAMTKQPQGEVLAAWESPKTATEAIRLFTEHKGEIDAIIKQSAERSQQALAIRVMNQATHTSASEALTEIVKAKDRAMTLLDPFRALLYDAYTVANNHKKAAIEPLEGGINHLKRQLNAYEFEQEQIRQRKLREEQQRAEEEARRLQEQQSQQLTLAEMQDALESGDTQKAEELAQKPIEVPRPYVAPAPIEPTFEAPKGQGTRANWKVNEETANMVEFMTAVKTGKLDVAVAAKYVKFDFPALNKMAKAQQEAFNVPGLTAWNDTVRSVRRGK